MDLSGSETILIVDDELALRQMLNDILSEYGYKILQASSGMQALELLKTNSVDLLISDIAMPEMGGHELVEKVHELYPEIKIQLVSGYSEQAHDDVLHKKCIYKPYSNNEMLDRVRCMLND